MDGAVDDDEDDVLRSDEEKDDMDMMVGFLI